VEHQKKHSLKVDTFVVNKGIGSQTSIFHSAFNPVVVDFVDNLQCFLQDGQ